MNPTFQGEVQLAGWSESHNGGCKVTFWLADPDDLDAFRAMTVRKGNTAGQRLACVLVEIGEDEQPVAATPVSAKKDTRGPLCKEACDLCANVAFRRWITYDEQGLATEEDAKAFILDVCGVSSRKELDNNDAAYELFKRFVRRPFMEYLRETAMAAQTGIDLPAQGEERKAA